MSFAESDSVQIGKKCIQCWFYRIMEVMKCQDWDQQEQSSSVAWLVLLCSGGENEVCYNCKCLEMFAICQLCLFLQDLDHFWLQLVKSIFSVLSQSVGLDLMEDMEVCLQASVCNAISKVSQQLILKCHKIHFVVIVLWLLLLASSAIYCGKMAVSSSTLIPETLIILASILPSVILM